MDDVVAARLLAWGHTKGYVNLIAAGVDTTAPSNGASTLDGFLKEEGITANIPIFVPTTTYTPGGLRKYQATMQTRIASYIDGGRVYESAVTVYRRMLANSAKAVDILAIGFMNNMSELLQSPADGLSPLTGRELVAQKVNRLWVMGGQYPSGTENNFSLNATARTAASYVCANWPTPVVFCGYEVGSTIITGGNLAGTEATDVLAQALLDQGVAGGRQSWDGLALMACLAQTPTRAGFDMVRGTNVVDSSTGANVFTASASGKDYYLVKRLSDAYFTDSINTLLVFSNWAWYRPF